MNALDILKYGDQFLDKALDGITLEAWEASGVCGAWTVKDIMAHLASYEHLLEDVLSGFVGGSETPTLLRLFEHGPDAFNRLEVAARHERDAEEVFREYEETYINNVELAAQIPAETFRQVGTLLWYGAEYALDDFIVYSFYGHKREHGAQINLYKAQFIGQF